jgi:valyl-tRNA synthetase
VLGALDAAPEQAMAEPQWTLADSWIWARLQNLERESDRLFGALQYGEAGRQIYEFFWSEFADWYLEIAKLQLAEGGDRAYYTAQTLAQVLDSCLRLLHPFTPFVTEELWSHLKRACQEKPGLYQPKEGWAEMLIVAKWPEPQAVEGWEDKKVNDFSLVQEIVRAVRNLRTEKKVTPGKRISATIQAGDRMSMLKAQSSTLAALAYLDPQQLTIVESLQEKPQDQEVLIVGDLTSYLSLTGLVDVEGERARLKKELAETQSQIERLEGLLSSPFGQKAPAAVVDKERQKLASFQETAASLREQLQALK